MVTVCTARFYLKHPTFLPQSEFMCCRRFSEETAIIFLYGVNWLGFIAEMECVYCAVLIDTYKHT
jgi:hypothetical protein